jgi:hypothetical protein
LDALLRSQRTTRWALSALQVVLRGLLGQVLGIVQVSERGGGSSWSPGPAILNLDSLLGLVGCLVDFS